MKLVILLASLMAFSAFAQESVSTEGPATTGTPQEQEVVKTQKPKKVKKVHHAKKKKHKKKHHK